MAVKAFAAVALSQVCIVLWLPILAPDTAEALRYAIQHSLAQLVGWPGVVIIAGYLTWAGLQAAKAVLFFTTTKARQP